MNKVIVAITVRSSSSRLPKKAFLKVGKQSIIEWCIDNCKSSKIRNKSIVVATTCKREDRKLKYISRKKNISFFAGSEKNIVNRMLKLMVKKKAKYLIRVTGDSPLIDSNLINILIKKTKFNYDFVCFKNGPLGIKPELISKNSIKKLCKYNSTKNCEYLSLFYKNNPKHFKIKYEKFYKGNNYNKLRLNIDYKEDLKLHKKLIYKLKSKNYNLENILKLYNAQRKLFDCNSNINPVYEKGKLAIELKSLTKLSS